MSFWTYWRNRLGLHESRCTFCLRPFQIQNLPPASAFLSDTQLCSHCLPHFAPCTAPRCQRCGLPMPKSDVTHTVCGQCLTHDPPWEALAFWGRYEGALRQALLRLKFDGELSLAPFLAACLLQAANCLPGPDALLAIPQHPEHLQRRGYNQAHELAKQLHTLTGLPLQPNLLKKIRHVPAQASLNASKRLHNVEGSFAAATKVRGMRLWLLDDVMTTGSTLLAACRCLRQAGAVGVSVLFVARTPRYA